MIMDKLNLKPYPMIFIGLPIFCSGVAFYSIVNYLNPENPLPYLIIGGWTFLGLIFIISGLMKIKEYKEALLKQFQSPYR